MQNYSAAANPFAALPKTVMKMKQRFLGAFLGLAIAAFAGAALLPQSIESRYNRVLRPPPYPASEAARNLHKSLTIVDLHADSLLWGRELLHRASTGHVDVPRLAEANVALQVFTVVTKIPKGLNLEHNAGDTDEITKLAVAERWPPATWNSLKQRALYQAQRLNQTAADSHGQLVIIRTTDDLEKLLDQRRGQHSAVGAILGIEGAHALEGDPQNLDAMFDAGFRLISPTHFFDNDMAGSSTGLRKEGLTVKGRELIRRMEAKHMVIDLAHASASTIRDVTAMASQPVIVSHTGVKGTCNNPRNLSDEEIRAVARTGGIIGIGYWKTAVCGADARSIAKAIRYATNIAGIEHVAIGSNFDGSTTMPFDTTGIVQITDALLQEGFSEKDIHLIMGENSLRVLRQVLPR